MRHFTSRVLMTLLFFTMFGLVKIENSRTQTVTSPQQSEIVLAQASKYYPLENTTSPNRQYSIFWGIPGRTSNSPTIEPDDDFDKVENYLVNLKTNKIITTIRNSKYFPHQNHGAILTRWLANSQLVLVTHDGKWQPRSITLVSVNGNQISVFEQLVRDVRSYLVKSDGATYQANKDKLAFNLEYDSPNFKLTNNQLQLPIGVSIPKAENGYERNLLITYQIGKIDNNLNLRLVNVKNLAGKKR